MTLREVGEVLRVGRVTALRLVQSGQLRAFRAGRSWRIKREDLEGFMRPQVAARVQTIKILEVPEREERR